MDVTITYNKNVLGDLQAGKAIPSIEELIEPVEGLQQTDVLEGGFVAIAVIDEQMLDSVRETVKEHLIIEPEKPVYTAI